MPLLEDIEAAAGDFDDSYGALDEIADPGTRWVEVDSGRQFRPDMFAAKATARPMDRGL